MTYLPLLSQENPMPLLCQGRHIAAFVAAFSALALLAGCERPTPVKELAAQPDKYKGQEVRVHGRVVSNFSLQPISQNSVYVVSDGTGQIGILTQGGAPATNQEVTVTGELKDVPPFALPVVGKFNVVPLMIEEKERKVRESR
jgi:hypothetical protein